MDHKNYKSVSYQRHKEHDEIDNGQANLRRGRGWLNDAKARVARAVNFRFYKYKVPYPSIKKVFKDCKVMKCRYINCPNTPDQLMKYIYQ